MRLVGSNSILPVLKIDMQHCPSVEGHLELKLKRWKCYFVKLTGKQLFLYHDFNANPMLIYIQDCATCKIGKSKRNNFQFSLHMGKATHHFRAPSELHRASWMMHILEATRAASPKRQPSQRSIYSISSLSSISSFSRYPDDFFVGAPSEYVQFCCRTRGARSNDASPVEPDLGTRRGFARRSLADCHLPLNNMRWYESAPPTPLPISTPAPSVSEEELDPDIISLPDISSDLLRHQKPKQLLQRAGGMDNLEALDILSQGYKSQDLSNLDFAGDSDTSSHLDTMDTFANLLQWPYYDLTSMHLIDGPLEPPRFHRSASLPHSLSHLSCEATAPPRWVHTRTHPALSVLSEKQTPDTSSPNHTPQNVHLSLPRDHAILDTVLPPLTMWSGNMELYVPPDTEGSVSCFTPGYSALNLDMPPVPHDYENIHSPPPKLPARTRSTHGNLIEVSKHMDISEPELFPLPPLPGLKRSVLRSITRQDAEEMLSGTDVGTFLVRLRESSPDKLALSIQMEGGVRHHRINSDTSGALSIEGFNCRESSLERLLRSFMRARNGKLTLLCPEEPLSDEETHDWESNNSLDFIL